MSCPPYKTYVDSGLAWLGEVPSHWKVAPVKTVSSCNDDVLDEGTSSDFEIEYVEISDVDSTQGILRTTTLTFDAAPSRARRRVRAGDVLVSTVRTYLRAVTTVPHPSKNLIVSTGFAVIRPRSINSQFLGYLFHAEFLVAQIIASSTGISYPAINASELTRFRIPVPPLAEQDEIVAFLDLEVVKIDGLVTEQTRLIELLKEKRQAVISRAVTKGLNLGVPTKDSGVEWLGRVPKHWRVARLKHITPQVTVGIVVEPSKYYVDQGIPALRSLNIRPGAVTLENVVFISADANDLHTKSKLRSGDLVAVRSGDPGTTAIVPPELDGCNCIDLIIIRKPAATTEEFLCWYLSSDVALRQFSEGSGGALQRHFNVETAKNLIVPAPPPEEQRRIVAFIIAQVGKLDELKVEAERAVALLLERRTALISAAVTGKIDVRGIEGAKGMPKRIAAA